MAQGAIPQGHSLSPSRRELRQAPPLRDSNVTIGGKPSPVRHQQPPQKTDVFMDPCVAAWPLCAQSGWGG